MDDEKPIAGKGFPHQVCPRLHRHLEFCCLRRLPLPLPGKLNSTGGKLNTRDSRPSYTTPLAHRYTPAWVMRIRRLP